MNPYFRLFDPYIHFRPVTIGGPITRPIIHPIIRPVYRPVYRPVTRPVYRPVTTGPIDLYNPFRPVTTGPITRPIIRPVYRPIIRPVTRPVYRPVTTGPITRPIIRPVTRPVTHPIRAITRGGGILGKIVETGLGLETQLNNLKASQQALNQSQALQAQIPTIKMPQLSGLGGLSDTDILLLGGGLLLLLFVS